MIIGTYNEKLVYSNLVLMQMYNLDPYEKISDSKINYLNQKCVTSST